VITKPSFISRADEALYKAKHAGRNRIEILPPMHVLLRVCFGLKSNSLDSYQELHVIQGK